MLKRLAMDEAAVGIVPEVDALLPFDPAEVDLAALSHVGEIHQARGDVADDDALANDVIDEPAEVVTHAVDLGLHPAYLVVLLEGAVLPLAFPLQNVQPLPKGFQLFH